MSDLEAEMAKSLSGKFFWEPSRPTGYHPSHEELRIEQVQGEIRGLKRRSIKEAPPPPPVETESTDDRVRRVGSAVKGAGDKYKDGLSLLKVAVASLYKVDVTAMMKQTNDRQVCAAKHHMYWAAVRYFPNLSIAEIARQLGKHHTVVLHSRKRFEAKKHNLSVEIGIIDKAMEGTCGF